MKIIITAFAAALLFIACKNDSYKISEVELLKNKLAKEETTSDNKTEDFKKDNSGDTTATPFLPENKQIKKQSPSQPIPNPDWDKKIIKTASLDFEVKDYKGYYSLLREKIREAGGYIAQEEQNQSDYKIENTLTIKVPVDQFDEAVVLLTANIEKLNEKKITSQDATAEFVDTKSRIEAKKQVRERYMDLLKQAKNMEEILSVQSEINGIQEEIESATGRIDYLEHAATFSTINLTYYQVVDASAKDNNKQSFGTKLSGAFKLGWNWIGNTFVELVSIWPLFLLVFILIIAYKRLKLQKPKQA